MLWYEWAPAGVERCENDMALFVTGPVAVFIQHRKWQIAFLDLCRNSTWALNDDNLAAAPKSKISRDGEGGICSLAGINLSVNTRTYIRFYSVISIASQGAIYESENSRAHIDQFVRFNAIAPLRNV